MKTYNNLYEEIISFKNLYLAYRKARKNKSKKPEVLAFEADLWRNLYNLHIELKNQTYFPRPLETFIITDPKTRKISKSDFRDRIVHHAIVRIIEPIFDKTFIFDSCANRKGKGNLFALRRFNKFKRKVTKSGTIITNKFKDNNYVLGYCFKADIKHYFDEVNQNILIDLIKRKITDERVINLIKKILNNFNSFKEGKGMPLGNLTSQFFANVYLNELDYFIKHNLNIKYYLRYVDDFVVLHDNKKQLQVWKNEIQSFLLKNLQLELHPNKSKVMPLSQGIDFVGFKNFYYFRIIRKRNVRSMKSKIEMFKQGLMNKKKLSQSFQGWKAYAKWANSYRITTGIDNQIKALKSQVHQNLI